MSKLPNTHQRKGRGQKMPCCSQNPLLVAWIHGEMPTIVNRSNLLSCMYELHFYTQATDSIWKKTHNHTDWVPFKFIMTASNGPFLLSSNPTGWSTPSSTPLEFYTPFLKSPTLPSSSSFLPCCCFSEKINAIRRVHVQEPATYLSPYLYITPSLLLW